MVTLLCTVRGCAAPLARRGEALVCPRGHSFDRAASGYWNLLQPQDRRSRHPGDRRAVALARRRLFASGHDAPLLAAILGRLAAPPLPPRPAVLDVGCGEGSVLAALAAARRMEAHGLDLSAPSIELAARLEPTATWVVANADRFLPYAAGAFDLVLSLAARRTAGELRRVLAPAGRVILAVPAEDDLIELRRLVLGGEGRPRDRLDRVLAELGGDFEPEGRETVRQVVRFDAAGLADLLAASYRTGRASVERRLAGAAGLDVTLSRDLAWLRPRPPG